MSDQKRGLCKVKNSCGVYLNEGCKTPSNYKCFAEATGMPELKKCPCGKTPTDLLIEEGSTTRWGYAYGDCCSEWMIEFRSVNNNPTSKESYDQAVKYWNDMPRAAGLEESPSDLHQELLHAVEQKYPGESRHETALRFIREAQRQKNLPEKQDNN